MARSDGSERPVTLGLEERPSMSARTKSKVHPKYKTKYRVQNWPTYEASLRQRGDIVIWFDEGAVGAWNAQPSGRPGGQQQYSDLAIITALTLPTVFRLALRQTEGFVASLIRLMDLDLRAPDHTTLSRRGGSVNVPLPTPIHPGPIHLVIDSTGLKMVGDGEWHVLKHKPGNKRRTWRKLHLGVDADGFIVASKLTESGVDDASVGTEMIREQGPRIARFTADGAYDTRAIYDALAAAGGAAVRVVIPPRREATKSPSGEEALRQRDAAIERIGEVGRRQWRKEAGAHQQARAENAMLRYKRIIGEALRARKMAGQVTESRIAVRALNRMTALGAPSSVAVVA
jgi:Transposase DDE domain